MYLVFIVWLFLCTFSLGVPGIYYLYLRHVARKPWGFKIEKAYLPSITLLVPTFNEAKMIDYKLENLYTLKYPKDLIQFIIVDSASTDDTLNKVFEFIKRHPEMKVKVLREKSRSGKAKALNFALQYASGDVIIVSDADSFLPSDALLKSLPILSEPSIGAFGGREVFLNSNKSWVTLSEESYVEFTDTIKIGESKIHSTIFFAGGFSAYKREFLDEFDYETGSDDCGTVLRIVQKKLRTVFVPEASYYTVFPVTFKGKLSIKVRRANQLVRIWIKCLNLLLRGKLLLPKRIAMFEIFLFLINPIVFALLIFTTSVLILVYLPYSLLLLLILLIALVIPRIRFLFLDVLQYNFILLGTLLALIFGKKFITWKISEERKLLLTGEMLKKKNLI